MRLFERGGEIQDRRKRSESRGVNILKKTPEGVFKMAGTTSGFPHGRHEQSELVRIARISSFLKSKILKTRLFERGGNPRQART